MIVDCFNTTPHAILPNARGDQYILPKEQVTGDVVGYRNDALQRLHRAQAPEYPNACLEVLPNGIQFPIRNTAARIIPYRLRPRRLSATGL